MIAVRTRPSLRSIAGSLLALGALLALTSSATPALADEPTGAPPRPPTPTAKPAAKEPLPVRLEIAAPSPDPSWTMRVVNDGDRPVRIAADARLLSLEIVGAKKHDRAKLCKAPAGLRPTSFPRARELYLEPGQAYEEAFDPRLFCFGETVDRLTGGTKVRAKLGFGAGTKEPFVAQGTDRPEQFAARKELVAAELVLPGVPAAQAAPAAPGEPAAKGAAPPKPATAGAQSSAGGDSSPSGDSGTTAPGSEVGDRNAPRLDIYLDRFGDAGAPRDVVVTIRAVNEGRRSLATVLRGRMLTFDVEALSPDGKAQQTTSCAGQHGPHAIASEALRDVRPGQEVAIPVLLAEMCPPATFARPGLYRVRPRLDTALAGEAAKLEPWVGQALAAQSALVRVATAREPYHATPPAVAGAKPAPSPKLPAPEKPGS